MENGNSPEGKQPLVSPRSILEILRICRPISSILGSSEWLLFGPRVFALSGLLLLNDLPTLKKRMVPEAFREKHGRRPGSEKTLPWKCKNPQMVYPTVFRVPPVSRASHAKLPEKADVENGWKTETPQKVNSPWCPHGPFWRSSEYTDQYH